MIIGSHNSMSYAKPVCAWYLKPFVWMARCQKANLHKQFFEYGVRYFDLRVKFKEYGLPGFYHGAVCWGELVYNTLQRLEDFAKTTNDKIYVRIILEQNFKSSDQVYQDIKFKEFCKYIQDIYKGLTFVGGRRKYDWELLYDFHTEEPTLDDQYSSTTHPFGSNKNSIFAKIDDFWPWLYARLHNKKTYKKGTDKDVLFLDYVNIK